MFFLPGRDKWDIPRASIERIDLLSTGAYDNVFLARLRDSQSLHNTVAVKVCHRDILDHDKRAFLLEAEYLKQFAADNHPNIIKIVGTCLLEEPLTIVMEFMENSDMSSFLIGNQDMSVPMQLNFARDIASGMQYLCSRNVVHRNLSSVNCLVSRSFVVKLSDFKQARDLRQVQV
jgi:serine/threonine protein kinase